MGKQRFDVGTKPTTIGVTDVATAATGEFAGAIGQKSVKIASHAAEGMADSKATVQDWANEAAEWSDRALGTVADDLTKMIRKHPGPALLIGLGIGYLLSRTMRHF